MEYQTKENKKNWKHELFLTINKDEIAELKKGKGMDWDKNSDQEM